MTVALPIDFDDPQPPPQRIVDPYHPDADADTFDLYGYLSQFDPRLLQDSTGRRILTRLDPMLFALLYLRKHLRDRRTGEVTFADAHFTWGREALQWIRPQTEPRAHRHAYVAPRACGKTTWWFLILPMWAAAHNHARFAAAFADSGTQAELHLATFKRELSDNELLRRDFPDLCEPARRHNGKTINDSQQMLYTRSGFAFAARGIDSTSLGLKVDEVRPDLLIFDDMEPDESNYSEYQMGKRLSTVQDAILPLNEFARVVVSGTVTMPGSLVHQLVRAGQGEDPEPWIVEERFTIHHTLPIVVRPDGTERSVWPAKWTMEFLNSIRHTRSYKKNFANDPMGLGGEYWVETDFIYGPLPGVTFRVLSVDPAIKTKKRSDFTGLAIVGYAPKRPDPARTGIDPLTGRPHLIPSKCVVEFAEEVKLTGKLLRQHILRILVRHPGIQAVMVEQNQGGEHWRDILHDLPCKLILVDAGKEPKEVRAANAVNYYQTRRVQHAQKLVRLEEQQVAFPRAPHDDMVDAVVAPVIRLLADRKGGRVAVVRPT